MYILFFEKKGSSYGGLVEHPDAQLAGSEVKSTERHFEYFCFLARH